MDAGAFALLGRLVDAPVEFKFGLRNARSQFVVRHEIAGTLVQMPGDRCHRGHTISKQRQIRIVKTDAAIKRLAQPVVKWFSKPRAVAGLSHLGTARKRVTGPVNFFREHMRRQMRLLPGQPTAHCRHMTGSFTRVNFPQRGIAVCGGHRWRHRCVRQRHGRCSRHCGPGPACRSRRRRDRRRLCGREQFCRRPIWRFGSSGRARRRDRFLGRDSGSVPAGSQRISAGYQLRNLAALRRRGPDLVHQLRQQGDR